MPHIDIMQSGQVLHTIIATEAFAEAHYPGAWQLAAVQPQDAPAAPAPRHISVGAFFDRFGSAKWAILADATPAVQAVIKDASVRSYIDLDNPDLPAGLALLTAAGHDIDAAAIVGNAVQPSEAP